MRLAGSVIAAALLLVSPAKAEPATGLDPRYLLDEVGAAIQAGRHVQADAMLSWLEQTERAGSLPDVAIARAELHMASNNVSGAASALARFGEGNGCRPSRVAGWIAGKSAEWNKAILQLARAIEQCGEDASLWNLMGLSLMGKGEHVAALEAFDSALLIEPDNAALMNNRAWALAATGQRQAAMSDLRNAMLREPMNHAIANNADYLAGLMGVEPVRPADESDKRWAERLAKAGEGARDSQRENSAMAYFASAALLMDHFDPDIWALGTKPQISKAD